jgi:hypothetical protein
MHTPSMKKDTGMSQLCRGTSKLKKVALRKGVRRVMIVIKDEIKPTARSTKFTT